MAESPEHKFVSSTFVRVVDQLSRSELFGYREADRGRFDFACVLQRDHSRQLVGQTLTRHAEGIEKDLNSLLFGDSSELPIYLYAQSTRNEARIREVLHEARLALPDRVALVRLYPYPPDFDADKESDRATVEECIRDRMVDDLLLNVLFGRLSATDVALFLNSTGIPGVSLAALEAIGLFGFFNFPELANNLGGSIN